MFLPESMYLFFMGLVLISVLHSIKTYAWKSWATVGLVIALASLVKPHAWLSAIAIAITLIVVGLGKDQRRLRTIMINLSSFVIAAAVARVIFGLIVAGPKALGFFGQYLGSSTFEQVVRGPESSSGGEIVGSSPMNGVISLFPTQLNVHLLVMSALMALAVIAVSWQTFSLFTSKRISNVSALSLFTFIWFFSLLIEIVIFTGWVTGGGDDHTSRVLLRYYEFLFVIVPLAGLIALRDLEKIKTNVFLRWLFSAGFVLLLTQAFSGFFALLTIQIADAPTLAGLVVNPDLFNLIAILSLLSVLVFATFPRFAAYALMALLPFSFIGLGWEIQGQYQGFRATDNAADKAGKYLSNEFSENQLDRALVLSSSRFDATLTAFWADSAGIKYELLLPGSVYDGSQLSEAVSLLVVIGDIQVQNSPELLRDQDGYRVYLSSR
jgi:hypothetical protein